MLVSVIVKPTPQGVSVTGAKRDSLILGKVTQLVAFHATVYLMAPTTATVHVTQPQDSVTAKTG